MAQISIEGLFRKYPDLILNRFQIECGEGWAAILDELFAEISRVRIAGSSVTIKQVKEKFGGLRIYWSQANGEQNPEIKALIDQTSLRSTKICEVCGADGTLRQKPNGAGSIAALCDTHARPGDMIVTPIKAEDWQS